MAGESISKAEAIEVFEALERRFVGIDPEEIERDITIAFEQWESEQMSDPEFKRASQKLEWRYQLAWRFQRFLAAIRTRWRRDAVDGE